jgi:hypothetical protein
MSSTGTPAASSDRRASRKRSVPASTPMRTRRVSSSTCGRSWSTRARAAAHVAALEARDQALHRQLAVLRAAAASPTAATLRRVHALSRLEAAERGRLLDRFWDHLTEGLPDSQAVDRLRAAGTPELPEHPASEQLDAWLELAELVVDQDFQRVTRQNALWEAEADGDAFDPDAWIRHIGGALAAAAELRTVGVDPADPRAAAVVEPMVRGFARILGRRDGAAFRRWLIGQLDAHTDPRAVRYWQPVGIIQGRPEGEFAARVADHAWLMAALRHHTATRSTAPVSTTASG